jgi:hypothetical protein
MCHMKSGCAPIMVMDSGLAAPLLSGPMAGRGRLQSIGTREQHWSEVATHSTAIAVPAVSSSVTVVLDRGKRPGIRSPRAWEGRDRRSGSMFSSMARNGRIARSAGALATLGVVAAVAASPAGAAPPSPPPGCGVVVNTPAGATGAPPAQAHKAATFDRLCTS